MSAPFAGRVVVLGVTGSIAAYKAAELASRLTHEGAEVPTILTPAAARFVTPLTFQALTGQPAGCDLFAEGKGSKIEHIALARRADLVLVAPATATTIARLAAGSADDLLSAVVLATTAPVLVAPAMNPAMWTHPATQDNLARLAARGAEIVPPGTGTMACGETGEGRLAGTEEILEAVKRWLARTDAWAGRRVLVTAGPTREPLDGVRFVTNASSGKMGFAVAEAARRRGAVVTLIAGPVALPAPFGVRVVRVSSGEEMRSAVRDEFPRCDALVMAAAVTDYRPAAPSAGKTKARAWAVALEKVPNILEEIAPGRRPDQLVVGFAAEAGDPVAEGERKLRARGLDLVVANDISLPGSGFGADANRTVLLHAGGRREPLPLLPKRKLAELILDAVEPRLRGISVEGDPRHKTAPTRRL